MSEFDFDLFVVGAGSGGVRCARIAAGLGAKVAVAEELYYGGTCVNVGCVPKKLFYYGSHFQEDFKLAQSFGWSISGTDFDWQTLRQNKDREIERLNGIYINLLKNNGVTMVNGRATLTSSNTLEINGQSYSAKHILIASGGWPFVPDIPGIEHAITSNEFFYLDELPKQALIVGGGYIAIEFACILHNLGVDVTLSYRGEMFLRGFDNDVRHHLKDQLLSKGMKLAFNHQVVAIEKRESGELQVSDASGQTQNYDCVLYATGRKPKVEGLGLENTQVQLNANGAIQVNDAFQTHDPAIYAVGDVIDRVQLTPVALAEGMFVANHLFGGNAAQVNYSAIPTAVFTQPSIGTVGLTEEQARAEGKNVTIYKSAFAPMKYSFSEEKERTLMKLIVDSDTDKVLGAHMVGPEAGEIIQGIGIAVNMGATKAQFDQTIGIHPTSAEEFVTMRTPAS